jgi:excisionase family DNA binding protein
MEKEFLRPIEVAEIMGLPIETVYEFIKTGKPRLPAHKLTPKLIVVNKDELFEYLEETSNIHSG